MILHVSRTKNKRLAARWVTSVRWEGRQIGTNRGHGVSTGTTRGGDLQLYLNAAPASVKPNLDAKHDWPHRNIPHPGTSAPLVTDQVFWPRVDGRCLTVRERSSSRQNWSWGILRC